MNRPRKAFIIGVILSGILACSMPAKAGDPPFYVKKATWHETAKVSQEALAQYKQDALSRVSVRLSPWSWIGPFTSDAAYTEAFPPEQEIVPGKTYDTGRVRDTGTIPTCWWWVTLVGDRSFTRPE
jgi:hypothetical protein